MSESKSGCLAGILSAMFGVKRPGEESRAGSDFPFQRRKYFFSRAEASLFGVLQHVLANRFHIVAKVRLSDLLFLARGPERRAAMNKIQSKHVDFVLCDRDATRPMLVIELDDRSHDDPDRRERDVFVDRALAAAGLPILHVRAARTYDPRQLLHDIESKLNAIFS